MTARPSLGPDSGTITGPEFFTEYKAGMAGLFDASRLPLTGVAGTANAVTATCAWDFTAGLVDGMRFGITWGASNTAGVTLAINGGSAVPVLDPAGNALGADAVATGLRSTLEYVGGEFVALSPLLVGAGTSGLLWVFSASGTWTNPASMSEDQLIRVQMWSGGGGGGYDDFPGLGGSYVEGLFRRGDLSGTVSVTVGAGGVSTLASGGTTSFGGYLAVPHAGYGVDLWASIAGETSVYGGGQGAVPGFFDPAKPATSSLFGGNGGAIGAPGEAPAGGGGAGAAGARGEVRIWA